MLHSGVSQKTRASKGVALYILKKLEKWLTDNEYMNEKIITANMKLNSGTIVTIVVYAKEEVKFVIFKFNNADQIILFGDLNARVGNYAMLT